jgi:integrase
MGIDDWQILETSRKPSIKSIRESLQVYFTEVIQKQVKYLAENDIFSFDTLNAKLKGAAIFSGNDAFREKIKELKNSGHKENASIYSCTLNSLSKFKGNNIQFRDISIRWLSNYQKFMTHNNIVFATQGIYFRTFRAIYNDAIRKNLVKANSYPFGKGKFEIPAGRGRDMAIGLNDIKRIAEYECNTITLAMCRDMWLFSFYCNGANFGDICRFRYSNIEQGEIYFYRKKTFNKTKDKREIVSPILDPMQQIIDRWGNPGTSKNDFIFPFLNDCSTENQFRLKIHNLIRLTNKQIKIISKALELPDISTYTARHCYATILSKNRVPESFIAEQLGHANRTVTQNYFDKYTKEERINYNSILL